jgi:SAM-dependent methyltransferase
VERRYTLSNEWSGERERLQGLERYHDPFTVDVLTRIGVARGWRCLEVAAGAGSIARWLAERVGATGSVVATDLDPRLLALSDLENVETRKHDILVDDLEQGHFDLVHARNLLVHLRDRDAAVRRLAGAVRPGGWLLLEEADGITHEYLHQDEDGLLRRVRDACVGLMAKSGFDYAFGRNLFGALRATGFDSIEAEGRVRVLKGRDSHFLTLTVEQLREEVVGLGEISFDEIDRALMRMAEPDACVRPYLVMSAWGRRP